MPLSRRIAGDLLSDYTLGVTGDDIAILLVHDCGVGDKDIHRLAWDAFKSGTAGFTSVSGRGALKRPTPPSPGTWPATGLISDRQDSDRGKDDKTHLEVVRWKSPSARTDTGDKQTGFLVEPGVHQLFLDDIGIENAAGLRRIVNQPSVIPALPYGRGSDGNGGFVR